MDLGTDASHPTVAPAVHEATGSGKVVCEQAVYTCICTPAGHGYRVIASSSGLPPQDCGEIIHCAPAFGGLCVDSPEAAGVSSFPISNDRHAILHTCHAGKEPTGRGGRRTYTRIIVMETDGLRRFRNNPFAVIRAVSAMGGLVVDLTADVALPQLTVLPEWARASPAFEFAGKAVPQEWIACMTDRLLAGGTVAVSTGSETQTLAELVLLTLPAPARREVSLSAGVTFAISRPHRLVVLANVSPQTRDRILSTDYVFLD